MQLQTILNRVYKHQSFIYTDFQLKEGKQLKLDITIRPRRNSRPICFGCGRKCPGYDTLCNSRLSDQPRCHTVAVGWRTTNGQNIVAVLSLVWQTTHETVGVCL